MNLVPASPLATDVVIKKWVVNKDEICVVRNGDNLKCRVTTHLGIVTWYPIDIAANVKINAVIDEVKRRAAILRPDTCPEFTRVSRRWRFTENKGCFNLLKNTKDNKIICQLYVKALRQYFQEDFLECLLYSDRCHPDTMELIDELKTKNLDEIIEFSKLLTISDMSTRDSMTREIPDFDIVQAKTKQEALNRETVTAHWVNELHIPILLKRHFIAKNQKAIDQRLLKRNIKRKDAFETRSVRCFLLEVEPFSKPSKIDSRVLVSQFRWAVTLICRGGCDNNSTSLIVEGLNNGKFDGLESVKVGEYFMYKVHFAGQLDSDDGEIKSGIFQADLKYYQRTEIWKVSSEKVAKMLKNIAEQKQDLELGNDYIKYDLLGPHEDNPGAHNCFSFLQEHLKKASVVDLETKTFLGFPYRVRNYTKYGSISVDKFDSYTIPAPQVKYYNFEDKYDYSQETTQYKEEI